LFSSEDIALAKEHRNDVYLEKFTRGQSQIVRYIIAILLLVLALIFGFLLFGRIALQGIESLGRNPLAKWTILSGIVINIAFLLLLIGMALLLSYIVLTV